MGKTSLTASVGASDSDGIPFIPQTDDDRSAVLAQLKSLMQSSLFANSKRYPRFLQYIVEETLAGRSDGLKERSLGIAVFGRDPLYDTNLDPVVRTSAAQVRQRVARYYADVEHRSELRIGLTPGSYIPEFRMPSQEEPKLEYIEPPAVPLPSSAEFQVSSPGTRSSLRRFFLPAVSICAILASFVAWRLPGPWSRPDAATSFWKPVWDEKNAIVFCVPGRFPSDSDAQNSSEHFKPLTIRESLRLNSIAWPDATTLYTMVGFVRSHGQAYIVRRAGDSSLADLRSGPTVFIGGFNNPWLLRLQSQLRFTYQRDLGADAGLIRDAQNPNQNQWRVRWESPYSGFEEDFGIVSRVWEPETEHMVMIVSGIAAYGTIAAGEFVTNPKYMALIGAAAPKGWQSKNLQVVFSTKVFNGNAGPPRIIATHVW